MADPKHTTKHDTSTRHPDPKEKIPPDPKDAVVRTGTLPVEPTSPKGEPVGHARHAESREEAEAIKKVEHAEIPPPGSRNFVAGQPVTEEELRRTEDEAARLKEAGLKQRSEAERLQAENDPNDPDHPRPKSKG